MGSDILSFIASGWYYILGAMVIAYLLGSLNFSIVITKLVDNGADIRKMGSGNAGFTNVLRSVGKGPAVATIVLDFLKGIAAALVGAFFFSMIPSGNLPVAEMMCYGKYIAGFCCILGHIFPLFFGFRGGKGVVTAAALAAVADWRVFAIVIPVFIVVVLITKIVSIGSLIAAVLYPVVTVSFSFFADYLPSLTTETPHSVFYVIVTTAFALAVCICIFVMHKENIKRLRNGTEKKLTAKKKEQP